MYKALAFTLAALLAVTLFASCGKDDVLPAVPETQATTGEDIPAIVNPETMDPDDQTIGEGEPSEAITTAVPTTTEEPTTEEPTTAAPKKPSGKEEIIAYVNGAMQKVRQEKPGYSFVERTDIDDSKMKTSSGLLDAVIPGIMRSAKGDYDWSAPQVTPRGADHNGVMPKVDLQGAWIKSATCSESGNDYKFRVSFVDEHAVNLVDANAVMHGRVMSAMVKSDIEDGAGKYGVKINKFDSFYSDSYIELIVDKSTGAVKKIHSFISLQATMTAKFGFTADASLPLANERNYTF
jgi:hypothetical protein